MRARLPGLALLLLLAAVPASAQRTLAIERFDSAITVLADGAIVVEETIVPRFTGAWNGIYRTIPVQYRTPQGLNYTLRISVESITDGGGTPLRYETSSERQYRKLKIWVPGAVDSTRTVRVRYRVANGLRFFDEHDELYWNVTGDEWDAPLQAATATVVLPEGVSGIRATAFRGAYGSTEHETASVGPLRVRVATSRALGFHEGLTVVVGWNPGTVQRPTAIGRAGDALYSNLPLAIPPIVLLGMWRLWRARGRDPLLAPIVTRYEPPAGMTPAELGTLADGKPDMRDITATIVDLAVRGYLRIDEIPREGFLSWFAGQDYRFSLTRPRDQWQGLKPHETRLLGAMFTGLDDSVALSDLKNKFYKHLPGLKDKLYGNLVDAGLYTARPDRVRTAYLVGGGVVGGALVAGSGALMARFGMQPAAAVIAGIAAGAIIALFGWFMPSRTVRGTRELEKVLGFQEFLSRVEADRLERTVKTPEMFEKFLPYAMALGVAEAWARAFEGIYREPPRWYGGSGPAHTFQPTVFTNNLGRMSAHAATVMASAPRGSGGSGFSGGSSGGGFGGGGGGGF